MIGASGGRSSGNGPRVAARRRFSDRERSLATPLVDDPQEWVDEPVADSQRLEIILLRISCAALLLLDAGLILFY